MIHQEATILVEPGKMDKFMEVFAGEFLPLSEKFGRKLIGQWKTMVGPLNEVINLWAYDDLTHMQRYLETVGQNEEMKRAATRMRSLISYEVIKLLSPTQYSSIK